MKPPIYKKFIKITSKTINTGFSFEGDHLYIKLRTQI